MKHLAQAIAIIMAMAYVPSRAAGQLVQGVAQGAMQGEEGDKTLSPFFFVQSDDPETDCLPLKSTSAAVSVAGVIADVTVTQTYKNEGKRPLEAIYVFPASTRAAVYGLKMTIGKRVITAEIKKREDARTLYEQARQEGKSATLLEQQRPNVFQMNVANIMPGDDIRVELKYTELLVPEKGTYEFVYPTVVGPRYTTQQEGSAPPSEHWTRNPYLHQGEPSPTTFDISVDIFAGLPIHEISSPSHKVTTKYTGTSVATVTLDQSEHSGGNKDFILRYRLEGKRIESGLLLYRGEKENFFLLMVQPPDRVTLAQIPRREYIFIVDVSGSMYGYPLEISKKLMKDLIGGLRPEDSFNVLLFAGGSSLLSETSLPATRENISRAISMIDQQRGGGGTELLPALRRALSLPRVEGTSRTVVIATDGYVSVEAEAFDIIRKNLGGANMFAFGIGTSVNRFLIEGMARAGMGESFVITRPETAEEKAAEFRHMIESPVLTGVKVGFGSFETYDVEPPAIPDVLAERPVIVFGKWRGTPSGKIVVSGVTGRGPYESAIDVSDTMVSGKNSALRYLWARHRIAALADDNVLRHDDARVREVTDLGLTYSLLTAYTSFVAVDSEVRNQSGKTTTVKQPLPLPDGVSDLAVGGTAAYSMRKSAGYNSMGRAPMLAEAPMAMPAPAEAALAPIGEERFSMTQEEKQDDAVKEPVKIDKIKASGGLSKVAIRRAIQAHIRDLDSCRTSMNLNGRLVLRLMIDPSGTIISAEAVDNKAGGKGSEQCVIDVIRKWRFPTASEGSSTEAIVTLVFLR